MKKIKKKKYRFIRDGVKTVYVITFYNPDGVTIRVVIFKSTIGFDSSTGIRRSRCPYGSFRLSIR